MNSRFYTLFGFVLALLPLLAGCGGSPHTASRQTQKRGSVQFTIRWPQSHTRLVPAAAQSIGITLTADGQTLAQKLVARSGGDAATSSVTFDSLPSVDITATAAAYPQADGTGTAQAAGSTVISVQAEQVTQASLTMNSAIAQIALTPANPSVIVGQSVNLVATATDAQGSIVLVDPSTWKWDTDNHQTATITARGAQGTLNGLALGSVSVSVTEQESQKSLTLPVSVVPIASGGSIAGQVTDATGQPLAGVSVQTSDGANLYSTTSDGSGQYALGNVPAGQRVVTFATTGRATAYQVTVARGGTVTLNATLSTASSDVSGPPVITLNPPQINQLNGQETVSGYIAQLDGSVAILIVNGSESLTPVQSDGTFTATAILRAGLNSIYIRATNSIGTTLSDELTASYTPDDRDFYFRATLIWDGEGDIDLHTFDPSGAHSSYENKTIPTGELDTDNVTSYGPENFTCRLLTPGRYEFGVNAFSRSAGRRAIVQVTINHGPNAGRTYAYGPYTFNDTDANGDYPLTGNTDFWWRPVDIVAGADGSVSVADPDTSISLNRSVHRGAAQAKKTAAPRADRHTARTFLHHSGQQGRGVESGTALPQAGRAATPRFGKTAMPGSNK